MSLHARFIVVAIAFCGATQVHAHDSWFSVTPPAGAAPRLVFSTGARYPAADTAPPPQSVLAAGCVDGAGRTTALVPGGNEGTALELGGMPPTPASCWIELHEFAIELAPQLVNVYFRDIHPPAFVRDGWRAQHARGAPWQERYRKFARIERSDAVTPTPELRAMRKPVGLDMEIVVEGDAPLRAGHATSFRVLSRGEPVPDLEVELVGTRASVGVWARTDAQGRLSLRIPFADRWLLRGTQVEADGDAAWRSRFVTLAFDAS